MRKLAPLAATLFLFGVIGPGAIGTARAVDLDMVFVPHAGNQADPQSGLGAVARTFHISRFEITNAEYAEFLNAVASFADPTGLWNTNMYFKVEGGISRTGTGSLADPYRYIVRPDMGDKPVNFVGWSDALRFVNWLQNGQPAGAACLDCTETGTYDLTEGGLVQRPIGLYWALPNDDEWFKAAFYTLNHEDGHPGYWRYPTQSMSTPAQVACDAAGDGMTNVDNAANYDFGCSWHSVIGNVASVGTSGGPSFYGTYDQGGNVEEYLESGWARGGNFINAASFMAAADNAFLPPSEQQGVGFRVLLAPEPAGFAMQWVGVGLVAALGFRRRSR